MHAAILCGDTKVAFRVLEDVSKYYDSEAGGGTADGEAQRSKEPETKERPAAPIQESEVVRDVPQVGSGARVVGDCFRNCSATKDRKKCADESGLMITVCLCDCHDEAVGVPALAPLPPLLKKWRALAEKQMQYSRESDAKGDGANSHTERARARIYRECAADLEQLVCAQMPSPEPSAEQVSAAQKASSQSVAVEVEEATALPRYGIRWHSQTEPACVLMADGLWTPWHLATQQLDVWQAHDNTIRATIRRLWPGDKARDVVGSLEQIHAQHALELAALTQSHAQEKGAPRDA